jgi:hypothetical protein
MKWIGTGTKTPRALALVYYNPDTQEWHVGDTVISRAMIENIELPLANALVAELVGREVVSLRKAIVMDHTLKDKSYGW